MTDNEIADNERGISARQRGTTDADSVGSEELRGTSRAPHLLTQEPGLLERLSNRVAREIERLDDWVAEQIRSAAGRAMSAAVAAAEPIFELLTGNQVAMSAALLRHYLEGTEEEYKLSPVPEDWQRWIVQDINARPVQDWYEMNPYNTGLYDLRNSLGKFYVQVRRSPAGSTYIIHNPYAFGFVKGQRHGFPLGHLSDENIELIRKHMPSIEFNDPTGGTERFEIRRLDSENTLLVPWLALNIVGKAFRVKGEFKRERR